MEARVKYAGVGCGGMGGRGRLRGVAGSAA